MCLQHDLNPSATFKFETATATAAEVRAPAARVADAEPDKNFETIVVRALGAFPKGHELTISYGALDNVVFGTHFYFVPQGRGEGRRGAERERERE